MHYLRPTSKAATLWQKANKVDVSTLLGKSLKRARLLPVQETGYGPVTKLRHPQISQITQIVKEREPAEGCKEYLTDVYLASFTKSV